MSRLGRYGNFADRGSIADSYTGGGSGSPDPYISNALNNRLTKGKRKLTQVELDAIKTKPGNKRDSVMSLEDIGKTQERLKKYGGQRAVEKNIDAGGDIYKGAKGMEYVTRTGALLGSPERQLINAGKASKNELVQGIAKGAEGFGRLGYKTGAIGARGVLNKVVGRTVTGKAARLGLAGVGLSAIGGAMKRSRQENQ